MYTSSLILLILSAIYDDTHGVHITFKGYGDVKTDRIALCGECWGQNATNPAMSNWDSCLNDGVVVEREGSYASWIKELELANCQLRWKWRLLNSTLEDYEQYELHNQGDRTLNLIGLISSNLTVETTFNNFGSVVKIPNYQPVIIKGTLNTTLPSEYQKAALCGECEKKDYYAWGSPCARANHVPIHDSILKIELQLPVNCTFYWKWVLVPKSLEILPQDYERPGGSSNRRVVITRGTGYLVLNTTFNSTAGVDSKGFAEFEIFPFSTYNIQTTHAIHGNTRYTSEELTENKPVDGIKMSSRSKIVDHTFSLPAATKPKNTTPTVFSKEMRKSTLVIGVSEVTRARLTDSLVYSSIARLNLMTQSTGNYVTDVPTAPRQSEAQSSPELVMISSTSSQRSSRHNDETSVRPGLRYSTQQPTYRYTSYETDPGNTTPYSKNCQHSSTLHSTHSHVETQSVSLPDSSSATQSVLTTTTATSGPHWSTSTPYTTATAAQNTMSDYLTQSITSAKESHENGTTPSGQTQIVFFGYENGWDCKVQLKLCTTCHENGGSFHNITSCIDVTEIRNQSESGGNDGVDCSWSVQKSFSPISCNNLSFFWTARWLREDGRDVGSWKKEEFSKHRYLELTHSKCDDKSAIYIYTRWNLKQLNMSCEPLLLSTKFIPRHKSSSYSLPGSLPLNVTLPSKLSTPELNNNMPQSGIATKDIVIIVSSSAAVCVILIAMTGCAARRHTKNKRRIMRDMNFDDFDAFNIEERQLEATDSSNMLYSAVKECENEYDQPIYSLAGEVEDVHHKPAGRVATVYDNSLPFTAPDVANGRIGHYGNSYAASHSSTGNNNIYDVPNNRPITLSLSKLK